MWYIQNIYCINPNKRDLDDLEVFFKDNNKLLEAERLEQRTNFDIETIEATGSCAGIENYSRYLTGRETGQPPPTLFEYLPNILLLQSPTWDLLFLIHFCQCNFPLGTSLH